MRASCPHIKKVNLGELTETLKSRKRDSFKHCDDCVYEDKKKPEESPAGIQVEEQLEFVMICLQCLHVGCTRNKLGHAERHCKEHPDHPIVRGIVGRLYCYECDQDIETEEDTKATISGIQRLFDLAISAPGPEFLPAFISVSSTGSLKEHEEDRPLPLLKHKSSILNAIEVHHENYAQQLVKHSKSIANIKGLQSLGSTRYFNAILQCIMATLPLVAFYLNVTELAGQFKDVVKDSVANYAADKRGARMLQFFKEYYSKTTGNLDPSAVFEIICSQKKYFGNFSEQDSLDALLTLLDALIDSQKEIYKAKLGIVQKNPLVSNTAVPIGSVFSFSLCNKLTCGECQNASWTFDPALNINAALTKVTPEAEEEEKGEETKKVAEMKRYRVEKIQGTEYYVPNKREAIELEDRQFHEVEKELDINYLMRRFFEEDHLDNPDDFFECPNCISKKPKGCRAVKEFFIKDPPPIFIIQLKRFKSSGFSYSKNASPIKNLEEIYLDKYVIMNDETITRLGSAFELDVKSLLVSSVLADPELKLFPYRLYAIASHSGSLYGGKYVSYVKQGEDWYIANDVYCNKITKAQALAAEAYLLFYQRLWQ